MNSETGYARKADSTTTPETLATEIAREALFGGEFARTDVVIPVNGSAPYSCVMFHGQRITFHDGEFTLPRTAGTEKAAAYAGKINDAQFELAKKAALAALTAPDRVGWQPIASALGDELRERMSHHSFLATGQFVHDNSAAILSALRHPAPRADDALRDARQYVATDLGCGVVQGEAAARAVLAKIDSALASEDARQPQQPKD